MLDNDMAVKVDKGELLDIVEVGQFFLVPSSKSASFFFSSSKSRHFNNVKIGPFDQQAEQQQQQQKQQKTPATTKGFNNNKGVQQQQRGGNLWQRTTFVANGFTAFSRHLWP